MSGIAGVAQAGQRAKIDQMLDKMIHRGRAGRRVIDVAGATLGVIWTKSQTDVLIDLHKAQAVCDYASEGHLAQAQMTDDGLFLRRDPLGVAPLYYGHAADGTMCFASEVKALLVATDDVHEFPAGHTYNGHGLTEYFHLAPQPPIQATPERLARELRQLLIDSVERAIGFREVGSWLSGGLDSSSLAALARPFVKRLDTFAAGVPGAPDLEHARAVADFIRADHHEVIVQLDDMLKALPDVIYHLESFDALLVRSSITNYLVARMAADFAPAVFSGEGGDELFAGYAYLKQLDRAALPGELIDITGRLHNTALQRVDRCASAHSTVAHASFLDPAVVDLALRIPLEFKLRDGVEKWILRRALEGALPEQVLQRPKAKFWEGAGVGEQIDEYAQQHITDRDFAKERQLPNGWQLNSKEELLYYRIFREHFGKCQSLDWMGRTKGAPVQQ